jgi:hypothetical protein
MTISNYNMYMKTGPRYKDCKNYFEGHWWFTSVILATQEAEIRRSRFKASLDK